MFKKNIFLIMLIMFNLLILSGCQQEKCKDKCTLFTDYLYESIL